MAQQPTGGQNSLIIEVPRPHSDKRHSVEILRERDQPLPDNTQQLQETDIYKPLRDSTPES